jgi:hypothetical protein
VRGVLAALKSGRLRAPGRAARGGGGAEERVELGLELGSDSGAGEKKTPTGGALLPAPERERERARGRSGARARRWAGEVGRARAGEGRKRGKEKRPRAGGAGLDRGVGCARREREGRRGERPWAGLQGGEREERERRGGGLLGWAQRREEREKKKRKTKQKLLSLNMKFEFNERQPKYQCKEHEMHKHMVFPIFILYFKKIVYQKSCNPLTYHVIQFIFLLCKI